MIVEVSWSTTDPYADCDEVSNDIREAFARSGFQVGDCFLTEMNHTVGTAHLELVNYRGCGDFYPPVGKLRYKDLTVEVDFEVDPADTPFFGDD